MTTYGTIPTSHPPYTTTPSSSLEFLTTARHKISSTLTTHRRPWNLFLSPSSLSLPPTTVSLLLTRLKLNLSFFRSNYAIVSLFILFCSLLWHPISLIVFLLTMSAWLFLFFLRDTPLSLFGHNIDDRIILLVLSVFTVALLLFTGAVVNIVVAIAVALVAVILHAAFRRPEDGVADFNDGLDDNGGGGGGGFSRIVGGLGERMPLKDTASSSFSAAN